MMHRQCRAIEGRRSDSLAGDVSQFCEAGNASTAWERMPECLGIRSNQGNLWDALNICTKPSKWLPGGGQVIAVSRWGPRSLPLAMVGNAAGKGTNECSTMLPLETTT